MRRAELLNAIGEEETRLARLDAERSAARTQLATLQKELASLGSASEGSIQRPLGVTRPDVFFAGDDAHDPGICIYLDGLSDGIHGNPETAARDRAIREALRAHRYEVIKVPASELTDRDAMRGHFFRLARLLVGLDRAREVRDQTGWFEE